jgi:1H-pyrrole-2-carbonyl-[peptidyl-carrier protein] chlorinase
VVDISRALELTVKTMDKQGLDADVLIIGGGPAGSTLGCLLALGDHKAIVVERTAHPREHVGELLTPSINAVLHRIGLLSRVDAAGFMRRNGVGWTTPGARLLKISVADHPPPRALRRYGFSVERDAFDALLLQHARELGVQVLERTAARRVLFQNGCAVGVEVLQPDGAVRRLTARFIVDASGRRSLLGTQLQLVRRNSPPHQCAFYAWFRDVEPSLNGRNDYAYLHLLGNRRKWGWQIPLRDNVTSVGIVAPCDQLRVANEGKDAYFARDIDHNRIFKQAMASARRVSPWRMVGDYSYCLQRLHGSGWLLVGDAAGFIDPIFSSGVDIAMYSSVFAYESMLPLLLLGRWDSDEEEYAMSKYEHRLRQGMAVWAHAVELFYGSPRRLRQLANQPGAVAAICRFLQGNPYELQNELIIQQLFDCIGQQKRGRDLISLTRMREIGR